MAVKVIDQNCITCGICVSTCPVEALNLGEGPVRVDPEKCNECRACMEVCPASAFEMPKGKVKVAEAAAAKVTGSGVEKPELSSAVVRSDSSDMSDYRGIWVLIEQNEGEVAPVSWELLGEGRKLAGKLGVELAGVLFGQEVGQQADEVFSYGADKLYLIEHPTLGSYRTTPYMKAMVELVQKYKPEIVLMGATTTGRDLSGAVATKLGTGLTADCTVLDINADSRLLEQTRPAFGGNIMATITCKKHSPQMATVRPRVMEMPEQQRGRTGEIIREEFELSEEQIGATVVEVIKEAGAAVYLDKSDIIVAGGRGIGSKKNWGELEELARVLGASVGASRAAVEAGWVPLAHQVGQTGQTVRPKVYIAVGISGAIQHLVGMQTADCIVAINNDPDAPIFKLANYGIIGEATKILPSLTKRFRERLAGAS